MGMNICVERTVNVDHPEWDYIRQQHDRAFPELLVGLEKVHRNAYSDDPYFRPTNLSRLHSRVLATGWHDPARYLLLIRLLEEGAWMSFSY